MFMDAENISVNLSMLLQTINRIADPNVPYSDTFNVNQPSAVTIKHSISNAIKLPVR